MTIQRFTGYRRNLSQLVDAGKVSHSADQRNADSEPQYEGVIWSDGTCTLRWCTAAKSTSVFASFEDMVKIHGHPEYGTVLQFHDGPPPLVWIKTLRAYGESLAADSAGVLVYKEVASQRGGTPAAMYVERADHSAVEHVLFGG